MFSRAHGTASSTTTTTTTTTYRTLASRSAAAIINSSSSSTSTSTSTSTSNANCNNNNGPAHPHSFLTGIAERTFTEPATPKPSSPAPARPSLRSVSVTSFLSDGTVEIEGFGFDEISEYGGGDDNDDDDDDNNSSIFGAESLYDDSVFGDEHEAATGTGTGSYGGGDAEAAVAGGGGGGGGGGGSGSGSGGDADLSRRAEKILANAKRKLDLCGRNISRARSSLILSPSATPTALLDHLDAVGPAVVRRRAESASGSHSQQWGGYNNRLGRDDRTTTAVAAVAAAHHTRTASESALHFSHSARGLGMAARFGGSGGSIDMGVLAEEPYETAEKHRQQGGDEQQHMHGVANRSNSTQQMRALRDQMKDLRGKITSLQEQTKSDSVRRRQSISSMRSHDSPPPQSSTALEGIRESRVLDIASPIEHEWQRVATQQRISADSASVYSDDRCRTPTASSSSPSSALPPPPPPPAPRREDVNSPTSSAGSNAFSYDNYLFGESFVKRIRPTSISSDGTASTATATLPAPPSHTIERKGSFVSISSYATADETPDVSPPQSPNPDSNSPPLRAPRRVESTLLLPGLRPPSDLSLPPPKQWAVSGSLRVDDGYHSAPHTPRVDKDPAPLPPPPPPSAPAARLPVLPASSWYRDSVDTVRTRSMLFEGAPSTAAIGGGGIGGGGGAVAISSSTRDSHTMVVGGMGGVGGVGGEIELRIAKGDRQLIEAVIEALGHVCCSMETAGEPLRVELRERLRGAMKVLEGEDPEGEMF